MKSSTKVAILVPIATALIGSFTTIAVTYINATMKVDRYNQRQQVRHVTVPVGVQANEPKAYVRMSVKGFYMSTNR